MRIIGNKNLFKIFFRKVSGSVKFLLKRTQNLNLHHPWGARVVQWCECSPPTNVARVQRPASTPYVGCVLLLVLSLAPSGFSPSTPVFPSP